ncbi:GHKL domain-containing protein [Clostridium estertheticum]|uniref:sensor histidine kinase n=1 Tax=Clostridium estertheticum TaxID=238834 RepID=UPI001C7C9F1D|nr:GHKL domain-containing protein [Clostridium estertheticum]MBX4261126.1 GHKL domain-containing protein [Clostridium estertheticum]WLC71939.1 GHKL domain-containing protein [Clostridium estertheticum]
MIVVLQYALVSFIELFIFMLLWSKFCFKDENNWLKNIFVILIEIIILIIINKTNVYVDFLIRCTSMIIFIKIMYKRSFIKTIVEFIVLSCVNMILQIILISCANLVGFSYSGKYIMRIVFLLIELICTIIITRCNFSKIAKKVMKLDSKILYYFAINLGLYIILSKFIWEYNKNIILDNLLVYIFIIISMISLNIFLYYYIIKISEDKKVLEVQNMYKPILLDIVEETRRRQHDFKNYLNTINAIVEVSSEKEVKNELRKYIMSLKYSNDIIEDIIYIENIIIKAIIYNKLCEAYRLNVKFLFNVANNSLDNSLNDYEISDILNNLLDNAFQAVKNATKDKIVILNICEEGNDNIVEVKNSGRTIKPENVENIFKRGFSTKKGDNRGYGLFNINEIAKKRGSDIQLSFEDGYTVFKMSFNQISKRNKNLKKSKISL